MLISKNRRIAWLPITMDHLVFTPWRDNEEILTVRRWLFPAKGSKDPDLRRKACSRVSALLYVSISNLESKIPYESMGCGSPLWFSIHTTYRGLLCRTSHI